jgi:hypothetical protein
MMHGEVKINDHEIARWNARRENQGLYYCDLEYTGKDGYHYECMGYAAYTLADHEFQQNPQFTPLWLVAAILETGIPKLKKTLPIGIQ